MNSLTVTGQFGGYLRAAPIKIFVGSEKTVYYVHPGVLLACKSSTANIRMSGSWKDVGDGAIDWTDFDEQTIEAGAVCAEELPPAEESHTPPQSPFPKESLLGRPLTPFQNCVDAGFPIAQKQTAAGHIAEKDFKHEKYAVGAAVLMHAKVYSFAHRHFFSNLASFALQHLAQILHLAPCAGTVLFPHLGDAIRHIYDTTPGPGMQDDPARKLLSQYFALNYTNLAGDELSALAEEGGELMVDISSKLVRLLATRASQVSSMKTEIGSLYEEVAELQMICNDKETKIQQRQAGGLAPAISKAKKNLRRAV